MMHNSEDIQDIEDQVAAAIQADNEYKVQHTTACIKRMINTVGEIENRGGDYAANAIQLNLRGLAIVHGEEAANIVIRYLDLTNKYGIETRPL